MTKNSWRRVLNPWLALTGMIAIISGAFIFFELRSPLIKNLHFYAGLGFGLCCLVHIGFNWGPLWRTLGGRPAAWLGTALLAALTLAMFISASTSPGERHRGRPAARVEAPGGAATVIEASGRPVDHNGRAVIGAL